MNIRVGQGYDVHRLVENHPFWLGGIEIPHTKGAFGHSDADVIIHAICDALLGAGSLGDIGLHFSDKDPQFKGIDSKILLKKTVEIIKNAGYQIGNVDVSLCLEKPKIAGFIPEMKKVLAPIMEIAEDQVSVKATTNEKMGFVGREEGVEAYAIALIFKTV